MKNALKAVVMKKRAFVEYDDRISYKNGIDSASEHLGKQVFALIRWMFSMSMKVVCRL